MKNFGILKTKIEALLTEAYRKKTIKTELKTFRKLVLENVNVKKLYYVYDNLSKPQGLCEETSKLVIDETTRLVNNLKNTNLKKLNEWVKDIDVENQYSDIDNLFIDDVTKVKDIVESKKRIINTLKENRAEKEIINLPLKTMVKVANQSLSSLIEDFNEKEIKEFDTIVKLDEKTITETFNSTKIEVIEKLENTLTEETDVDVVKTITETIEKINNEVPSHFSFYRLIKLKESI